MELAKLFSAGREMVGAGFEPREFVSRISALTATFSSRLKAEYRIKDLAMEDLVS